MLYNSEHSNYIEIELPNGYKLVAVQNENEQYPYEMFIDIFDRAGMWHQELAVVRPSYRLEGGEVIWSDDSFDILVYSDANNEDFTHDFTVGLYKEEDEQT